jgi:hypothetical protein
MFRTVGTGTCSKLPRATLGLNTRVSYRYEVEGERSSIIRCTITYRLRMFRTVGTDTCSNTLPRATLGLTTRVSYHCEVVVLLYYYGAEELIR